ncbi:MAG: CHAT domain-containing protein [Synechococcales bacterium]|nr:CHAT domain-containing protein [Synechococcales bacterium]
MNRQKWPPLLRARCLWGKKLSFGLGLLLGLLVALSLPLLPLAAAVPQPSSVSLAIAAPTTLLDQGRDAYAAGRLDEAIAHWQQAAQQFEAQGNTLSAAIAHTYLGLAQQQRGDWAAAAQHLDTSLAQLATLQTAQEENPAYRQAVAQALNAQGRLALSLGQPQQALHHWQQAQQRYDQGGDRQGVLGSRLNQVQALEAMGMHRRACATLLEALDLEQDCATLHQGTITPVLEALAALPDEQLRLVGLRNVGTLLRLLGALDASEAVLSQAVAIAPDSFQGSITLLSLGNTQRALFQRTNDFYQQTGLRGDREQAEAYFRQSRATYQRATSLSAGQATGAVHLQAQVQALALLVDGEVWQRTAPLPPDWGSLLPAITGLLTDLQPLLAAETAPSWLTVTTRLSLVQQLLRLQAIAADQAPQEPSWLDWAAALAETARQQAREIADLRSESYALGLLGQVGEMRGQQMVAQSPQRAEDLWQQAQKQTVAALAIAQSGQFWEVAYRWQWQLGRLYAQKQQPQAAIPYYQAAVQTLEAVRDNLLGVNADVQFSFRNDVEPVYRQLVALLLGESPGELPQAVLQQAIQQMEALQVSELENFLGCSLAETVVLSDRQVDPTAVIVYPILLEEQLAVILRLPQSEQLHLHTINIPRPEVEATLIELRRELEKPYRSRAGLVLSQKVYDWLLRPVADQIAGAKNLVFVLDGELRNVPMAVLHDGDRYLVESYAIALMPSLQLFEPRPLTQIQLDAVTFGLSQMRKEFPPHQGFADLENVETELAQIQSQLPSRRILNQEFTEAALRRLVETVPAPIVHLATHGQFSSRPDETFVLAWDERIDINDLSTILRSRNPDRAPIELLVLSACKTADGDNRAALGLAGIAVQSGARSTLASLWYVDDRGTAELMSRFYEELSRKNAPSSEQADGAGPITRAEALRRAQVSLLRSATYQSPLYWAPYILVGNWL